MRNYIIRRLLLIPVVMLGVSFLTFIMFRVVVPGDAAILACGFGCTRDVVEDIRHEKGLARVWTGSRAWGACCGCRSPISGWRYWSLLLGSSGSTGRPPSSGKATCRS